MSNYPNLAIRDRHARTRGLALFAGAVLVATAAVGCKKADEQESQTDTTETPAPSKTVETPKQPAEPEVKPAAGGVPKLADAAGSYAVDVGHSTVVFRAKHFGVSYTYGRFNRVEGAMTIDPDLAKSSVSLEVAADSVYSADKKRDDHLKGTDFLDAKQFPKITFKSTAIKEAGPGKYEVTGDLTLHGKTNAVTATFEHVGAGTHPFDQSKRITGFHGYLSINRGDYGMNYMPDNIGDQVDLVVSLELISQ